jgi:hypothetical protein
MSIAGKISIIKEFSYKVFYFDSYCFDFQSKTLLLNYSLDDSVKFTETLVFDFDFSPSFNKKALDQAFFGLFVAAGISYFKTYIPGEIRFRNNQINAEQKKFFEKLYLFGLGEFFYRNDIDLNGKINFISSEAQADSAPTTVTNFDGSIVSLSGGKDSIVTSEILKNQGVDFETWTLGEYPFIAGIAEKTGKPHAIVKRILSPNLIEMNKQGALNGHVPISSIIAFVGVCVAILKGKKNIIVAEGTSSREENVIFKGVPINHQYSKTILFEKDFQEYVHSFISPSVFYFSFVRPLSELKISELLCKNFLKEYKDIFSSCNSNFKMTNKGEKMFWCGKCPKCASTFALFSPFLPKEELISIFGGKNLFVDPELNATYEELLGVSGIKPFECVGEIMEIRKAISLARKTAQYPELDRFVFEEDNFDWQGFDEYSMPEEFVKILKSFINK